MSHLLLLLHKQWSTSSNVAFKKGVHSSAVLSAPSILHHLQPPFESQAQQFGFLIFDLINLIDAAFWHWIFKIAHKIDNLAKVGQNIIK